METYYQIGEIVIKIIHENDDLFKFIHYELGEHEIPKTDKIDGEVYLKHSENKIISPDKGAILLEHQLVTLEIEEKKYELGNKRYIEITGSGIIKKDHKNRKIEVIQNKKNNSEIGKRRLYDITRNVIKWLIIKIAEQRGYIFNHGAALDYKEKRILFIGDSGCGKSSFLIRMNQLGATAIADDAILIKESYIIPFSLKASIKGDFIKRFKIKEENKVKVINSDNLKKQLTKKPNIIIFPKIWKSQISKIVNINEKEAIKELSRIYINETKENSYLLNKKEIDKKNKELIKNVKAYEFYAGYNEEEIMQNLIKLIEGEKNDKRIFL